MSVLDEHIAALAGGEATSANERAERLRRAAESSARQLCRRLVSDGARHQSPRRSSAGGIAAVLATMELRLSPDKTVIAHIDEGLDCLGWRTQRYRKRGARQQLRVSIRAPRPVGGRSETEDVTSNSRTQPVA